MNSEMLSFHLTSPILSESTELPASSLRRFISWIAQLVNSNASTKALNKKLVSSDQAVRTGRQHIKPCKDCPWTRGSLPGWLGGTTVSDWLAVAHSDQTVKCHCTKNQQCAGIAIYRRNVCKMAYPPNLRLEADREKVFASRAEFTQHHDVFKR
jgi:hypothetical protein